MWEKEEDDRVGEHGKEISFKKVGIKLKSKENLWKIQRVC